MKRTDITALLPEIEKEKLDRIMELNGQDVNAARGESEKLQQQLAAATAELEQLKARPDGSAEKLAAVQKELDDLKGANALRDLRERVSKDTGVPASLLTAETEEACKTQAEAIKAYAKPGKYPPVPDGGEVRPAGGAAPRDKFAAWMEEQFPSK